MATQRTKAILLTSTQSDLLRLQEIDADCQIDALLWAPVIAAWDRSRTLEFTADGADALAFNLQRAGDTRDHDLDFASDEEHKRTLRGERDMFARMAAKVWAQ